MEKTKNIDKIFEDLLEDDFINVFKPLFFIQRIFGVLGVNIKYKFINPPTTMYKAYCCIVWFFNSVCIIYSIVYCSSQFDPVSTDIPLKVGMFLNGVVNVSLAWKILFNSGHSYSQLYVKMQKIQRYLKMKTSKIQNRKLFVASLFFAFLSVAVLIMWSILFHKYISSDFCPTGNFANVVNCACYIEIFLLFTILHYISVQMQYINDLLRRKKTISEKAIEFTTSDMVSENLVGENVVQGTCYILESFSDTMNIFEHATFFFTCQMLVWLLIPMQNLALSLKNQLSVSLPAFLCTLPCSLAFMVLMMMLCFMSESLSAKLEACEELCTVLSSSLREGESRENAKRIALLLKGRRPLTVYNIFNLDTRLPLHLLGITASYTIVLLQFAAL